MYYAEGIIYSNSLFAGNRHSTAGDRHGFHRPVALGNGFPRFEVTDDEGFNKIPDSISSNIGLIVVHYYSESKLEFDAAKLAIHNQFIHFRQNYVLIHDVRFGLEGYSCLYRNSTDFS
jgi:hypothetical protein